MRGRALALNARWAWRLPAAALAAHVFFPVVLLAAGENSPLRRAGDWPARAVDAVLILLLGRPALARAGTLAWLALSAVCWAVYAFLLGAALDYFRVWTQRRRSGRIFP